MRMLVTRPEPDAQATLDRLAALGIDADSAPMLVRRDHDGPVPLPDAVAAIALTSTNALRALAACRQMDDYMHLPVYAVGERTAGEAEALGFTRVKSAAGSLGDLAALILHERPAGTVFHPSGRHRAGDLARSLAPHGIVVESVELYDMEPVEALPETTRTRLAGNGYGACLFYSARTAETFAALVDPVLEPSARSRIEMLCLSEAVAAPLIAAHLTRVSLADAPDETAMMSLALAFAREQNGA
jgi:uroporphyrinogen-III synthase